MEQAQILKQKILQISPESFDALALEIFRFQADNNLIYQKYLQYLDVQTDTVKMIEQIPFMPIEFFKTQTVITGKPTIKAVFESSGTTGQNTSRHHVAAPDFYLTIAEQIFERVYGKLADFQILALLPSYLERSNSSLVYMVEHFIKKSGNPKSGFFLNDYEKLARVLKEGKQQTAEKRQKTESRRGEANPQSKIQNPKFKTLLIGVTFGLLDFAESGIDLSFLKNRNDLIVMETGGMKGRRKELLREEVHEILTKAFHVNSIHSEYGMTELLSQGYSSGEGVFELPLSMKILFRDVNDPFIYVQNARSGGINVIDLANVDSCCFIETKDLGAVYDDQLAVNKNRFKILGRFDNSDIRGCNLMIS